MLADYVTLDAGTGVVHTAPGHGSDDYATGIRYGLDVYAPVGPGGHYTDDVLLFAGLQVWAANPKVEEALHERARLWHREEFGHSYPHCWRCHNPVIFLATSQWFIAMDRESAAAGGRTLRAQSLDAIKGVEWIPAWGQERIHNMLANRPDWCISRQRSWGVPIPALSCQACQHVVLTPALIERAAAVFDVHGADAWYERPLAEFVPEGAACPSCGGTAFDRETNILDVWFDSGSSHEAVLAQNPALTWPAAVYLEGSDQYRGWFHSSLLVGLGTRQRAPFERVITHGFVVATDGRKMSKSLGNTVVPQDVIKQHGAEIIRLWAAMVDYREEVRLGKEILARVVEAYRKLRNTLRFLAGNLFDFDPVRDRLPIERLQEVDRYVLARYAAAAARCPRGLRYLRLPGHRPHPDPSRHRRHQRLLLERLEGLRLHARPGLRAAPLGADRDVRDGRRARPAAGADPADHRRRALAGPARHARARCISPCCRPTSTPGATTRWSSAGRG